MGYYVAGDTLEVTWNHPTLGSGVVQIQGSQDNTIDLGGIRINDDANQTTGSGSAIVQMNMRRWEANFPAVAWDMNIGLELQLINALSNSPVPAEWTISNINGSVYGGTGWPVADLSGNTNNSTFPLKISGGGKLEKKA